MKMLINGQRVDASNGAVIEVFNPATGELLDTVPSATQEDVEKAISIAHSGKASWAETPMFERATILRKFVDLLEEQKHDLAKLQCLEMGKIFGECLFELTVSAKVFTGFIEKASHLNGEVLPESQTEHKNDIVFTRREPLGVITCIVPFNYPVELFSHKVAPALLMGNSVIVKPASENPLIVIRLVELLIEAGVPGSAIQIITGSGASVGKYLVDSKFVNAVSLTGSTQVGLSVARNSIEYLHQIFLELGGNDSIIILPDADIDYAVDEVIKGRMTNTGQTCCATKRVLIHQSLEKIFTSKLLEKLKAIKRGNPIDPNTGIGCLISERAAKNVEEQVKSTIEQGAKCIYGGKRDGAFYDPTVLVNVNKEMSIAKDMEIFGPVIPIIVFDTKEEAIEITNLPIYGLHCGIITNDIKKAINMAAKIEVGNVILNGTGNYRHMDMAFGGTKMTGLGREGINYTLEEMSKVKSYVLRKVLE